MKLTVDFEDITFAYCIGKIFDNSIPYDTIDSKGNCILHMSATRAEYARLLSFNVDINTKNNEGLTPLEYWMFKSPFSWGIDIIRLLISKGANFDLERLYHLEKIYPSFYSIKTILRYLECLKVCKIDKVENNDTRKLIEKLAPTHLSSNKDEFFKARKKWENNNQDFLEQFEEDIKASELKRVKRHQENLQMIETGTYKKNNDPESKSFRSMSKSDRAGYDKRRVDSHQLIAKKNVRDAEFQVNEDKAIVNNAISKFLLPKKMKYNFLFYNNADKPENDCCVFNLTKRR